MERFFWGASKKRSGNRPQNKKDNQLSEQGYEPSHLTIGAENNESR